MRLIILLLFTIIISNKISGQGCVAIKSNGGYCSMPNHSESLGSKKYTLSINSRYFKSYKHFVGKDEQEQRVDLGTEVINHASSTDFNLQKMCNKDWSIAINVPIIANTRSSLYEHGGLTRHSTKSFGMGDIRLAASKWLINTHKMSKGNVQIGLGVKLPTGDFKYADNYYVNDSTQILGPVDQSIQLGDGGLGFTTEVNAYYSIIKNLSAYGNFYYLLNPREQNGTLTSRGNTPSVTSVRYGSHVMSVPDQYMVRVGLNYMIKKFTISAGVRDECIPVYDLIGGSNGFRRPGYIISAEPGITYEHKLSNFYIYTPIALVRNRTQSVADKNRTKITGVYAQGDAAFADYSINIGYILKF